MIDSSTDFSEQNAPPAGPFAASSVADSAAVSNAVSIGLSDAFSNLAPELAATFVSVASDIALVIDADGVIRNVATAQGVLGSAVHEWVGRPWADTVTPDTRKKVEQSLNEAGSIGTSRRYEVNHRTQPGADIPMAYSTIRLGEHGPVLAVGRDLRAIAAIQQRFVDSQREMERDYWKLRQAESRYRLLFQVATDAVLVVDGLTMKVQEANAACAALFHRPTTELIGQDLTAAVARPSRAGVEALLSTSRSSGRSGEIRAQLGGSAGSVHVSATPFRGETGLLLLVRARAVDARESSSESSVRLADFVERMPDAVVIVDSSGRVVMANPAFLNLCGLAHEAQAKGRSLADWAGDGQASVAALLDAVRHAGIATHVDTVLQAAGAAPLAVEVSAVLLEDGDQECIGLTLRRKSATEEPGANPLAPLAQSIERLATKMGSVALPELMREAMRLAERHLLGAALHAADGDVNAAAEVLAIDPQALRTRMLQHGLAADGGAAAAVTATAPTGTHLLN